MSTYYSAEGEIVLPVTSGVYTRQYLRRKFRGMGEREGTHIFQSTVFGDLLRQAV